MTKFKPSVYSRLTVPRTVRSREVNSAIIQVCISFQGRTLYYKVELIYAKRRTRKPLEDILGDPDDDNMIHMQFVTTEQIRL